MTARALMGAAAPRLTTPTGPPAPSSPATWTTTRPASSTRPRVACSPRLCDGSHARASPPNTD